MTFGERTPVLALDNPSASVYNHEVLELEGYGMNHAGRLNVTFAALADPTRRAILARLAAGEASVLELAKPFAMSQPAISKHLRVLERAGLISRGQDAQRRPRRIEGKALREATGWLAQYRQVWESNYCRLDAVLAGLKGKRHSRKRSKF
jgi:DNA-binding transcriptional ArsR family regulator